VSVSVPDFSGQRVAVVGDLVADHYLRAEPRRLSREAPVMVLRHRGEEVGAGGAANVARNLRALGAEVEVFGAVGRDPSGRELLRTLEADGIGVAGVISEPGWTTPTKTRVLAAESRRFPQQVLRIDREPDGPLPPERVEALLRHLRSEAGRLDALVVSDYEYGLVGEPLAALARELAGHGKVVVLDPRRRVEGFEGITAMTPNVGELAAFAGVDPDGLDDAAALREAATALWRRAGSLHLLVTRGNLGMALFGAGLPAEGVAVEASGDGEVTDVSGAGDTAASVFALALAAGCEPTRAMVLANAASGRVVMENGTAVCSRAELEGVLATAPAPTRLSSR
jgi:rfaE bifunctional protein kinase chain/domain